MVCRIKIDRQRGCEEEAEIKGKKSKRLLINYLTIDSSCEIPNHIIHLYIQIKKKKPNSRKKKSQYQIVFRL